VGAHMQKRLAELAEHRLVGEHRGIGLIAALELVTDKDAKVALEKPGAMGAAVAARMLETGVISRPIMDAVAFCPPLIITKEQVDEMVDGTAKAIDLAAGDLGL